MPPRTSPRKKAQVASEPNQTDQSATRKPETGASKSKREAVANKIDKGSVSKARAKAAPTRATGKRKVKAEEEGGEEEGEGVDEGCASCAEGEPSEDEKPAKKRKTTAKTTQASSGKAKGKSQGKGSKTKEEDEMPLADRTTVSTLKRAMYIGAHVSGAGGVHNSIGHAHHIGGNAFALFLKSQRKWESPPLAPDVASQFASLSQTHAYDPARHVLPHGSYLVNLAQADAGKAAQAYGSFLDDLKRCEALGIRLYNFHPGNTGGAARDEACGRISAQLNRAHGETEAVVTVLENMAGAGNTIGTRFEDLRDIIAGVKDKSRVGVCLDTCHAFAAGYDLRTPEVFEATVAEFDRVVGLKYLVAFHLNDSKAPFASHRDLHANIGTGFLGLRAFHSVVNHEPFQGMPMVLETPIDHKDANGKTVEDKKVWADEIKLLESLIGMDPDTKEFAELEARLQEKGDVERKKIQDQVDKKAAKDAKKGTATKGRAKGKGKKKNNDQETDDESE